MNIWYTIIAMSAVTYAVRLLPMLLLSRMRITDALRTGMQITPFCIMVSMLTIDLLAQPLDAILWRLSGLLPVALVTYLSGNVGLGVLAGVVGYSGLLLV